MESNWLNAIVSFWIDFDRLNQNYEIFLSHFQNYQFVFIKFSIFVDIVNSLLFICYHYVFMFVFLQQYVVVVVVVVKTLNTLILICLSKFSQLFIQVWTIFRFVIHRRLLCWVFVKHLLPFFCCYIIWRWFFV